MPFGAGVQMAQSNKQGSSGINSILDSADSALNYYTDQPMLQGIQKAFGNSYDNKSTTQKVGEVAMGLPSQFVPTTLNQINQSTSKNVKETYNPDTVKQNVINQIVSRIPVLSNYLPNKVDVFGNNVKQYQGNNNFGNVFLNPLTTTTESKDPTQQELYRLYQSTGEKTFFPRVADKTIQYKGQKIQLSPQEYTQYQKELGQQTIEMYNKYINSDYYKNATDDIKVKILKNILDDVAEKVRNEIILNPRGLK
jgi:hypothetical protein